MSNFDDIVRLFTMFRGYAQRVSHQMNTQKISQRGSTRVATIKDLDENPRRA